ncbi:MAG: hypothetical protein ABIR27_05635 [Dokdonella sp.]
MTASGGKFVNDRTISPFMLGSIHGGIDAVTPVRLTFVHAQDTCAEGCCYRRVTAVDITLNTDANFFSHRTQGSRIGIGNQQSKFLTSKTEESLIFARYASDHPSNLNQHVVTRFMTESIVYILEMVEIENDESERFTVFGSALHRSLDFRMHSSSILRSGQRIDGCKIFKFLPLEIGAPREDERKQAYHNAGSDKCGLLCQLR